ncbi:MAG: twin-arginine translocase subunit TatC [Chloroflexi bacterium]|nr:twin-arginine translocase subunit TatC [Chloroflexota bacterium]
MTVEAPRRRLRGRQPDPKYMTFIEHLQELRQRLIVSIAAIAVGSVVGWFLAPRTIHLLIQPLRHAFPHQPPVVFQVYGAFTLQLKIAIIIGFMIALPVTLYQLWGFLAPAFGRGANLWAPLWIGSALLLFAAGAATGFFVVPLALKFFSNFQGDVQVIPNASDYVSFLALILIVFGISFELPLVVVSLSAVGLVSSRALAAKRLHAFFGCFIFSTIATPGADLVSPIILGAILYVLYELGVLVSRLIGK